MRLMQSTTVVLAFSVLSGAQAASDSDMVARLKKREDGVASIQAFQQLRQALRSADASRVEELRKGLCQEATVTPDPVSFRRIGRLLAAAPCDEILSLALAGLDETATSQMRQAACDVISSIGAEHGFNDQQWVDAAFGQLKRIIADDSQPVPLLDSALLAMASLGPRSTDVLLGACASVTSPTRASNVFYSALGRTGDLRVLPFLRDALTDPAVRQGYKIQAANALGQLAADARMHSRVMDQKEKAACVHLLTDIIGTTTDDQLAAVALQALAQFQTLTEDGSFSRAVLENLYSPSWIRREAALQAIYAAECPMIDPRLTPLLRDMAVSGQADCAATAQAILDKCGMHEPSAP